VASVPAEPALTAVAVALGERREYVGRTLRAGVLLALFLSACQASEPERAPKSAPPPPDDPTREPDVLFWATPDPMVDKMLELAKVSDKDLVYDLGCGDGRILIRAAKKYGARAYGVDIDAKLVDQANAHAKKAGVSHLVKIERADIFTIDLTPATVVTLYLLPWMNKKLIPQLAKLESGSRIIAYQFPIPGVEPEHVFDFDEPKKTHRFYLWEHGIKVPEQN
jgi:SAM-dependent methyltransferase